MTTTSATPFELAFESACDEWQRATSYFLIEGTVKDIVEDNDLREVWIDQRRQNQWESPEERDQNDRSITRELPAWTDQRHQNHWQTPEDRRQNDEAVTMEMPACAC